MKKDINLVLSPAQASSADLYKPLVAEACGIPMADIALIRITRKSVDARGKGIRMNMSFEIFAGEEPTPAVENTFTYQDVRNKPEIVVAGAGPAGLFASLRLIELGYRPVLLERGKKVNERKTDIDQLENNHILDPDSNYCFGEGGAGTFSDGKLYTRSKKRGDTNRIMEILYLHGAGESILYEAHPHIGSDKLPHVVAAIREKILECGGEINFNTRITGLELDGNKIKCLITASGEKISGKAFILATGHSARDIYYMLNCHGIDLEAKAFAMGIRVEHPQELIDQIQYHGRRDAYLPSASYSLVEQVNNRGVYSFCMCPGGQIVPSATAENETVVNGMSLAARNSQFANSGIVVQINPNDYRSFSNHGPLAGLRMQEVFEQRAHRMAGKGMNAPAQRLTDFVSGKPSRDLPVSSYVPGLTPSPMHEWMPDFISNSLAEGFKKFDARMKGFLTREAMIAGVESRTSSPVRIPRNPETGSHTVIENLFPAGEGAGYAGGIISSAVDGENAAGFCARYIYG